MFCSCVLSSLLCYGSKLFGMVHAESSTGARQASTMRTSDEESSKMCQIDMQRSREAKSEMPISHEVVHFLLVFTLLLYVLKIKTVHNICTRIGNPMHYRPQRPSKIRFDISPVSHSGRRLLNPLDCGPFKSDRVRSRFRRDGGLLVSARNLVGVESSRTIICQKTINQLNKGI